MSRDERRVIEENISAAVGDVDDEGRNIITCVCLVQMTYESWREQAEEGETKGRQAEIGNVFLIDRGKIMSSILFLSGWHQHAVFLSLTLPLCFTDVDFVTPLCSQVVYEGLVDDIFRIKCGEYQNSVPIFKHLKNSFFILKEITWSAIIHNFTQQL